MMYLDIPLAKGYKTINAGLSNIKGYSEASVIFKMSK